MNYEDVTTIENGLKAMLEDEEKGIKEYEPLIKKVGILGATHTAMELQKILEQEKKHAQILRNLLRSTEIAKVAYKPEKAEGTVRERHRARY